MNNQIFFFFYNLAHQSSFFDYVVIFFGFWFPFIVIILAGLFLFQRFSRNPDPEVLGLFRKNLPERIIRACPPDRMIPFIRAGWRDFFLVFFSGGIAVFFDLILKYFIHTPRPFVAFTNISALFPESGYAFPSGHATFFSALAISLFFLDKKVGYVFMFFALLIGLARIIAGVHFPIDILGGFILGFLVAFFVKNV